MPGIYVKLKGIQKCGVGRFSSHTATICLNISHQPGFLVFELDVMIEFLFYTENVDDPMTKGIKKRLSPFRYPSPTDTIAKRITERKMGIAIQQNSQVGVKDPPPVFYNFRSISKIYILFTKKSQTLNRLISCRVKKMGISLHIPVVAVDRNHFLLIVLSGNTHFQQKFKVKRYQLRFLQYASTVIYRKHIQNASPKKRNEAKDPMSKKFNSLLYQIIKSLIHFFYPRIEVVGEENLPGEPCIIVGNHAQLNGPICAELYCPGKHYTWCAGEMMHLKDVPGYAFQDFWSQKPKWTHPWFKLVSYLIAPLSVVIFNNANTISVYHDTRIIGTFKNTVKRLQEGNRVVIFPEHDVKHNHILYEFQDRFIDVAKLYYKKTGKQICFVPLYIAPKLKQMHFGNPTPFDPNAPAEEERQRVCRYLTDEITDIACALPEHTVIPYRNIPKKYYPKNTSKEGSYAHPRC